MLLTISIANREIAFVVEQQKSQFHWNGVLHDHTVDMIQHFRCGYRRAVFVKYAEDVEGAQLKDIAKAVGEFEDDRLADDYDVSTEEDVNLLDFENAEEIIEAAKSSTSETRAAVVDALPHMADLVTPNEIGSFTGLGEVGANASLALIQADELRLYEQEPIDFNTVLINTSKFAA